MVDPPPVPLPVNTPAAVAFTHEGELIWAGLQLIPVALALLLLFTGLGARWRNALERLTGRRGYLAYVLFACSWLVLTWAATAPLHWLDAARWVRWGADFTPHPGSWLAGQAATLAVMLALAAALLWVPRLLIARLPRLWWLALTAIIVPLLTAGLVLFQVAVMPMTTRFEPLKDPALVADVQAMASRCGLGPVAVFVGGDDTTVVGLGPTSRILISRRALDAETPAQVRGVLAHELKHYRMGDNWLAIAVVGALILAGLFLVQVLGRAAIKRWSGRFGFTSLADPAALPLIALILTLAWALAGLPIFNAVQRHAELEADRFALELTRDNDAIASWQASVAKAPWRMVDYDWTFRIFFATHPSDVERIRLANSYRPWAEGKPGAYDRVCRPPAPAQGRPGA